MTVASWPGFARTIRLPPASHGLSAQRLRLPILRMGPCRRSIASGLRYVRSIGSAAFTSSSPTSWLFGDVQDRSPHSLRVWAQGPGSAFQAWPFRFGLRPGKSEICRRRRPLGAVGAVEAGGLPPFGAPPSAPPPKGVRGVRGAEPPALTPFGAKRLRLLAVTALGPVTPPRRTSIDRRSMRGRRGGVTRTPLLLARTTSLLVVGAYG